MNESLDIMVPVKKHPVRKFAFTDTCDHCKTDQGPLAVRTDRP